MATPLQVNGKEFLVQALNTATTLKLELTYTIGVNPTYITNVVSYGVPVQSGGNAYSDITASSVFTIANDGVVIAVKLLDGTTILAIETITTDNTFPNGGDFIVTNYKVTVA